MRLYAIYNKGPHTSAAERAWYGSENGYYDYTGWPEAITKTSSFNILRNLSKAFEVAGQGRSDSNKAYAVRDEEYYESQMLLQYGDGDFIPGVHHTVPKIMVKAIFTDENEAKAAYPGAQIRTYEIGW